MSRGCPTPASCLVSAAADCAVFECSGIWTCYHPPASLHYPLTERGERERGGEGRGVGGRGGGGGGEKEGEKVRW